MESRGLRALARRAALWLALGGLLAAAILLPTAVMPTVGAGLLLALAWGRRGLDPALDVFRLLGASIVAACWLWLAFAPEATIAPLAPLAAAWLLPAALLELTRRFTLRISAIVVAGVRDLALILFSAQVVAIVNGVALALVDHPLLQAGARLSMALIGLRTLWLLHPWLPGRWTLPLLGLPLLALALLEALRLFVGDAQPVRTALDVGLLPVFDPLLVGYLLPAVALGDLARRLPGGWGQSAAVAGAVFFLLAWLHFEIRHLWHGAVIAAPLTASDRLTLLLVWLGFTLLCGLFAWRTANRLAWQAAGLSVVWAALRLMLYDVTALPWEKTAVALIAIVLCAGLLAFGGKSRGIRRAG